MIDHVGLAARVARIPVSTLACVYAHINPAVKRVLDRSILTRKVNRLLIPSNISPNPILVIRSYVKGGRNIRLSSSPKVIYSSLCTVAVRTPKSWVLVCVKVAILAFN